MIETEKSSSSYGVFVWPSSGERFYESIGSHPLHGDPSEAATGASEAAAPPPHGETHVRDNGLENTDKTVLFLWHCRLPLF
ncbi:hypothetical protein F2Q68_00001310 [Brassica cretica]|uniref:Uncharacterized protein n=1 Tax=Brassica cretica TaxID=69181 RepID=A0A8S9J8Y3_BRACR|nr:hypothetical protein F2Q68_00001310 [Brassica cretica]